MDLAELNSTTISNLGDHLRSMPMRRKVTTNIVAREIPREVSVSSHIVRYCHKDYYRYCHKDTVSLSLSLWHCVRYCHKYTVLQSDATKMPLLISYGAARVSGPT